MGEIEYSSKTKFVTSILSSVSTALSLYVGNRYYKAQQGGHQTLDIHIITDKGTSSFLRLIYGYFVKEMKTGNQKVGDSRQKALDKLRSTTVTTVLSLVALTYRKKKTPHRDY